APVPGPRLDPRARRGAAGLPAAAGHAPPVRRAAPGRQRRAGDHRPVPHPPLEVVHPLRVPGQPADAHAVARRPDDLDERGGRRPDRGAGQRLDRGGQPQRCRGGPGGGVPQDARGHRLHVPRAGTGGRRPAGGDQRPARRHPQLADPAAHQAHPPHRRVRPAQLRVQLPRPDRQPARRGDRDSAPQPGGDLLMRVMAQLAMVMNLDKCIGCHTCSVTCKQAWTNRSGVEYVWFNNVETRPGQGYPRTWQDQRRWQGGWVRTRSGRLKPRSGGRLKRMLSIFANPKLPSIRDYYEPWTYDYDHLLTAPAGEHTPVARPRSVISGKPTTISWSANWDDSLAGGNETAAGDPVLARVSDHVQQEFEKAFMFFLPRICEHCLNPSCAAACPSGAIYKRSEAGIVLADQDRCRGWRMSIGRAPG